MLAPVNLIAPKWPTVTARPIANGAVNLESVEKKIKFIRFKLKKKTILVHIHFQSAHLVYLDRKRRKR